MIYVTTAGSDLPYDMAGFMGRSNIEVLSYV